MKKILVTGSTGQIGSELTSALRRKYGEDNVVAVGHRRQGDAELREGGPYCSLDVRDLRPLVEAFFVGQHSISPQRRRQRMAWEWMAMLYDQAALHSAMIITTSNKTKRLLGLGTDFGQYGYSFNLLGDLYQSQVRELALVLNIPNSVLDKNVSSLALADLGCSITEADGFMYQIVDVKISLARLLELGVEEEKLRRVYRRIKESAFRRTLTPVAESSAVYVPRSWNAGAR